MKIKLKIFLRLFFALCFINKVSAEHIVGGVISYECLGDGASVDTKRFRFKVQLFYDCSFNSSFDQFIDIGIYRGKPGSYRLHQAKQANIGSSPEEAIESNSCALLLNNICVKTITYVFQIDDLPVISENYMIAFQRCCRNMTIANIIDPGRTGSTILLEMGPEAVKSCNSSPQFDKTFPLVACVNEDMLLKINATDKENDAITYELCAPYSGGGTRGMAGNAGSAAECLGIAPNPANCIPELKEVVFRGNGITSSNPFPSAIPINIINGVFMARPNEIGQYIFGICIKEYRNGILLTIQRRDVQINVARCDINIKAELKSTNLLNGKPVLTNCYPEAPFRIINSSKDSINIKKIEWVLTNPSGTKIVDTNFHFQKTLTDTGLYTGKLFLNKGNKCSDSIDFFVVTSNSPPSSQLTIEYQGCENTSVRFVPFASSTNSILLTFGDGTKDTLIKTLPFTYNYKKPGLYSGRVITQDPNGCNLIQTFTLALFPLYTKSVSLNIKDTSFCFPETFTPIINENIDTTYAFTWTISDGRSFKGYNPKIPINATGRFSVKLNIKTMANCVIDTAFSTLIVSKEKPIADFTLKNDKLTLKDPKLELTNNSRNAKTYFWNFGDQTTSPDRNPVHSYNKNGNYKVSLTVTHSNGCIDSLTKNVSVGNIAEVFTPNVFTPNGDGVNDIFLPKVVADITSYELTIFNRWGSLLFKSSDPEIGWDGRNQSVRSAPIGVYIYQIKISFLDQATKVVKGSVTLVR